MWQNMQDNLYPALFGVQDVQLIALAARTSPKNFVDAPMRQLRRLSGSYGLNLFDPQRGGSQEVFNKRPLAEEIKQYYIQEVQFLLRKI